MDELEVRKKKVKKIYKKTVANMKALGTFKPEFDAPVSRYADMSVQYDTLLEKWYDEGCEITEEYTNKAGATNQRKTPLYMALEVLRKELTDMENLFGLTPRGLKSIKQKGLEAKAGSALERVLNEL